MSPSTPRNPGRSPILHSGLGQEATPRRSLLAHIPDLGEWNESPTHRVLPSEPRPIVVVHGTVGGRGNFARMVPYLRSTFDGRDRRVFSVSYGDNGTTPLAQSIAQTRAQIAALQEATGAESFDLVAHSQGGLISLAVASRPGGEAVNHIVGLGSDFRGVHMPWSGTARETLVNRVISTVMAPAFAEQVVGSPALADALAPAGECTVPITQIASDYDRLVPLNAAFALGDAEPTGGIPQHPGPLRLVRVQDFYPQLQVAHNMLPRNQKVSLLVKFALENPPAPRAAAP